MEIDPRLRPGSDSRGAGGGGSSAAAGSGATPMAPASAPNTSVPGGVGGASVPRQLSPHDPPPHSAPAIASPHGGYHNNLSSAHVSPTIDHQYLTGQASTPSSGVSAAPQGSHAHQSLPHTPNPIYPAEQTGRDERDTSLAAAGDGAAAASEDPNDPLADIKRPRACEACRQLKVRCEPDNEHPEGSCRRCAKAKRQCVVTVPSRKRQKKTDSRVAELEKKIDALTASLHASRARNSSGEAESGFQSGHQDERRWSGQQRHGADGRPRSGLAGNKRVHTGEAKRSGFAILPPLVSRPHTPNPAEDNTATSGEWLTSIYSFNAVPKPRIDYDYTDVIDRKLIDVETATKAFDRYVNEVAPFMPVVVFPSGTTMSEVRRTKPLLFLAILSVSIGPFRPDIQPALVNETHRNFADRILIRGEKSLEIVQALLVSTLWYSPPDHFEELKFYQLIHISAVMAMELGMNRRTKTSNKPCGMWKELMSKKTNSLDPDSPETRRAWMGCYFMGVNASMSLRRPLLIRWQPYMDECIDILRNSPNSLPSDKLLCHWMKLAHISEEIGFQFSMDDPATNVTITDPKIQYALKGFKRQLDEWQREVAPEDYTPVLRHYESVIKIYMHEIAMHIDHNIDDFRPPFVPQQSKEESQADLATPVHVDALTTCLASIHDVFNHFLSFDLSVVICLPTIYMSRTSYASVALVKLLSAASAPGSRLGKVFDPSDLQVEYYFDRIIDHLKAAGDKNGGRTPAKFSVVLGMLKKWFLKRKDGKAPTTSANNQGVTGIFVGSNYSGSSNNNPNSQLEGDGNVPGPWSRSAGNSSTQQGTSTAATSLHVLSEVAMGEPSGSSDTHNRYQHQNQQGGSGNASMTPVSHSGPNPHDISSNSAATNPGGINTGDTLSQYAPTHIPLDQSAQLHQPTSYQQYEQQQQQQQQQHQQPHSTVPQSLFDVSGNPVSMPISQPQSQMPYSQPDYILDYGFPFSYEPDELAALGNMLGDGSFDFTMDWNDAMM